MRISFEPHPSDNRIESCFLSRKVGNKLPDAAKRPSLAPYQRTHSDLAGHRLADSRSHDHDLLLDRRCLRNRVLGAAWHDRTPKSEYIEALAATPGFGLVIARLGVAGWYGMAHNRGSVA